MMGNQFIAGRDPESVPPRLIDLGKQGCRFTLDLLGELVASDRQADEFATRYRAMMDDLPPRLERASPGPQEPTQPRVNISIKLSSLTHK